MGVGMKVDRLFTMNLDGSKGQSHDPFSLFRWKEVAVLIKDAQGNILCDIPNLEVPEHWSQQAAEILGHKYLRKSGVHSGYEKKDEPHVPKWLQRVKPGTATEELPGSETSFRQVAHRIASHWTYAGWNRGYFGPTTTLQDGVAGQEPEDFETRTIITPASEENARAFYDEIVYMLCAQMVAPNSPQFFNTGLWWAYGTRGETINWIANLNQDVDKSDLRVPSEQLGIDNAYEYPQTSACFISSIEDTLIGKNGIMDALTREATIFKYGSGSGINYSTLRAKGASLSSGGKSSGMMSFLKVFDANAGAIKSGGTTRRAARMVTVNADHPEALDFVKWKHREELKVAAMEIGASFMEEGAVDAGEHDDADLLSTLNGDYESEAYETVSGQNSNNSLRVTDEYMETLSEDLEDDKFHMSSTPSGVPMEPSEDIISEHNLVERNQELWDALTKCAWSCGDPGIQFHDTANKWHTVPKVDAINASNPCSEFMFLDNSACNLASINLIAFYKEGSSQFDAMGFMHVVDLFIRVLDITVGMSSYPDRVVAENSVKYRPLGLGYANLGGLLMAMGVPYGSKEGLRVAAAVTSLMQAQSFHTSAEMARKIGPFHDYSTHHDDVKRVIALHRDGCDHLEYADIVDPVDNDPIGRVLEEQEVLWNTLDISDGIRNAQLTLLAPTGTISFIMDCATTGIEPEFSLIKMKKLAGGGTMKMVNPMIARGLDALGYDQSEINSILEFIEEHGVVPVEDLEHPSHAEVFDCANDIPWQQHIAMMAYVQPFLSGAISKTVNMPANATRKDVAQSYVMAWKLGLKALAIYRDGCKDSQPLTALKKDKDTTGSGTGGNGSDENRENTGTPHDQERIPEPVMEAPAPQPMPNPEPERQPEPEPVAVPAVDPAVSEHIDPVTGKFEPPKDENGKRSGLRKTGYIRCDAEGNPLKAGSRYKLPARRAGFTQKVRVGGYNMYLRTGEYEDGSVGEVFITIGKEGSMMKHVVDALAIAMSLGLQYGVPLDEYVEAFVDSRSEPSGFVSGSENVRMCSSLLDYIVKELDATYGHGQFLSKKDGVEPTVYVDHAGPGGDTTVYHTVSPSARLELPKKANESKLPVLNPSKTNNANGSDGTHITSTGLVANVRHMTANGKGHVTKIAYSGSPCPSCFDFTLRRNGSCFVCDNCGSTTGCS